MHAAWVGQAIRVLDMPALRLVEMLNGHFPWDDAEPAAEPAAAPASEVIREYEARRCHVCQCRYPPFGFGPPLIARSEETVWACAAHRAEVDRMLRGPETGPGFEQPRRLL